MITIKIDVTKIRKEFLHPGRKGTYLDLVLFDRPDDYGNDGFVKQDIPKEARDAGEQGPILGNWKRRDTGAKKSGTFQRRTPRQEPPPPRDPAPPSGENPSDIPF